MGRISTVGSKTHLPENPPKWNNRTLTVHERVDSRFLVLPGSETTIPEITEYVYFSSLKPFHEFDIKVSKILY